MTIRRPLLQIAAMALLLLVGSCGGSLSSGQANGGMGGSGSGSGQYANGGMGGSGSGTASGYGSILVDGNRREYPIDPHADITVDGKTVSPSSINAVDKGIPLGMQLEFLLAGDANADLTSGTAIRIVANHRVIGPVTSIHPLTVMHQPVLTTPETVLDGITQSGVDNLAVGDVVKVDGLLGPAGMIRATQLVKPSLVPSEWQLKGHVSSINTSGFSINGQQVDLNGVVPQNCPSGLAIGQKVLVRATKPASYTGGPLTTTLSVQCLSNGLSLYGSQAPATLPTTVDGIITSVPSVSNGLVTLSLNGQQVQLDPTTLVQVLFGTVGDLTSGNLGDLKLGTRIEVDGTLDTATGVISATSIRFPDPLVSVTAPVSDGPAGKLLLTLGHEVRAVPGLSDPDGLFANPDTSRQVTVQGFVTDDGTIYASSVVDAGPADPSQVAFTGPITSVNDSLNQVILNSIPYDTTTANSISLQSLQDVLTSTTNTLCSLLGGLLGTCSSPPSLQSQVPNGSTGQLTGATWDNSTSTLQQGDLLIRQP